MKLYLSMMIKRIGPGKPFVDYLKSQIRAEGLPFPETLERSLRFLQDLIRLKVTVWR